MVQREIADRLRAAPGSRTYGSPSVLAQLACEVRLVRTVDPAVFRPRPRVESAILGLRRTGPGADPATRALVRAAFAHRRKSLARSLEHGRAGRPRRGAERPRRARPARRRARRGALARASSPPCRRSCRRPDAAMPIHAPAKLNLCLFLGPRREDGLHELCSLFEPLALADSIEVSEAERDEVVCAGVEGENLAARALAGLRERGWERAPLRIEIEKRIPVAAGLGGGSADAAAVLRLAGRRGRPADSRSWRPRSAPTCPRSSTRRWRWSAAPGRGSRGCPTRRRTRSSCCRAAAAWRPPRSSPRPTGSASAATPRSSTRWPQRLLTRGRRRRLAARLRRAARQRPRAGGPLPAPRRRRGARARCARPARRWRC